MSEKRRKTPSPFRRFLREYRVELIALIVMGLGVFLLVEPFDIRETLVKWIFQFRDVTLPSWNEKVAALLQSIRLSDLVGGILLVLAVSFFAWRVNYRLRRATALQATVCPRCEGELRRVHRSFFDRLFSRLLLLPLRRYMCSNSSCGWKGLRLRRDGEFFPPPPRRVSGRDQQSI